MMNRERNERKKWQGKERGIGIEERNEKRQRDREGECVCVYGCVSAKEMERIGIFSIKNPFNECYFKIKPFLIE